MTQNEVILKIIIKINPRHGINYISRKDVFKSLPPVSQNFLKN